MSTLLCNPQKNRLPPSAAYSMTVIRLAALKLRIRKSRSGSRGDGARSSTITNRASRPTAAASTVHTSGAAKPMRPASISAKMSAPNPAVANTAPAGSRPRPGRRAPLGTWRARIHKTTKADGTLIKKIQRHDTSSTSQPPSGGPIAMASAVNADQVPMARPLGRAERLADDCKASRNQESGADALGAARKDQLRAVGRKAAPQVAAKTAIPMAKMRRRPN